MIEINGKNLCENCFSEMTTDGDFCTNCGYNPSRTVGDPTMLKPGSVLLGKYVVGKVIGKGGFGVTYVAYDVTSQKKVAIKEYFPYGVALRAPGTTTVSVSSMDNAEAFKMGAEKFYNEAKMVSRFNGNPNIVGVHEFFYENDTVYFAMEYLKGHTLKDHIQEHGVLTPAQALFIFQNVSNALMAAHSQNVMHRDISPDNIILCDNGDVKLIDFGAARQVVAEHSQSFSVILKPGFAPLEQYQKKGNQGPWTDIYSLGATIYHSLTGDIPEDPMSRIDDDEEFSSNAYNIEPELWAVIQKATQLKIEDRYADVFMLKNDLNNISYQPEPVIVPTEDASEKMPEFQTAVPFGMTQTAAAANNIQPVANGAVQPAPAQQKPLNSGNFFKKHGKIVAAIAAVLVLVIGAAIIIPNVINSENRPPVVDSDDKNSYTSSNNEDSKNSTASTPEEEVEALNTLARTVKDLANVVLTECDAQGKKIPSDLQVVWGVDSKGSWSTKHFSRTDAIIDEIRDYLDEMLSDTKDKVVAISIADRKVSIAMCANTNGNNSEVVDTIRTLTGNGGLVNSSGRAVSSYKWNGKTAGITDNGIAVGTCPVISLGSSTVQTSSSRTSSSSSSTSKPPVTPTVNLSDKIFYNQCNATQKKIYELVYATLDSKSTEKIDLTSYNSTCKDVFHIWLYVAHENSKFNYLKLWTMSYKDADGDGKSDSNEICTGMNFEYVDDYDKVKGVLSQFNNQHKGKTVYEKLYAFHDMLIRDVEIGDYGDNSYAVLVEKKGTMWGIAKTYCLYAQELGLQSVVMVGKKDGELCYWCRVKIDGVWYNVDVYGDAVAGSYVKKLNVSSENTQCYHTYFLCNDDYFIKGCGYTPDEHYKFMLNGAYAASSKYVNYYLVDAANGHNYIFEYTVDSAYDRILYWAAERYRDGNYSSTIRIASFILDDVYNKMKGNLVKDLKSKHGITVSGFDVTYSIDESKFKVTLKP